MFLRLRFLLIGYCLGCSVVVGAQADPAVIIISSNESTAAYQEATQALVVQLERGGVAPTETMRMTVADWSNSKLLKPGLFIALGAEAAAAVAAIDLRAPVLCALIPRSTLERILLQTGRKTSTQFSAIYLDQPMARQFELIRLALPTVRRVGVLWGAESLPRANAIRSIGQRHGLELVEASVSRDDLLYPGLKRVLEDAQLLLAVPDPQVYNGNTIQNILLSSFRASVPMVAFSPAYVRAGALLALYGTPTQVGQQVAGVARAVLQGKPLPAQPLYPQEFTISVNQQVAHSLGLNLNVDVLSEQLRRREPAP
jgi:ABC-type uncharacterized transport system substrate-binding protein